MPDQSSPFDSRAEELYLDHLARRDRGEAPDFDALCAAHPEFAEIGRASCRERVS
jgi:hypothetical protein